MFTLIRGKNKKVL